MRKGLSFFIVTALVLVLAACGSSGGNEGKSSSGENGTIGISMPSKTLERWVSDGSNMKKEFEKIGYGVDLQYAEDVIENQVSQIENMITKGVKVIVIAPIDGESLTDVLDKAAAAKIEVIAYDRLIKKSKHVSFYATFDNFKVGVLQASYIEEKLGLKEGKGPFNIELFGGSPDDNNAYFFYDGAMSVLQPYIDNGKLIVRSGQTTMDKIATMRWDGATAQSRMDNLLSANYSDAHVDAVLAPNDAISIGVISSLKGVGYGSANIPMPITSGQDAELASVKSIIAGEQTSTVFKDTRALAQKVVSMVQSIMKGEKAEVNDTTTYDNGEKVVPSYLLEPVIVDKDNYKEILIDSGYYSEDQFK